MEKKRLDKISELFGTIQTELDDIKNKHQEPFKTYRDKSYAHHELLDIASLENDKQQLQISWHEIRSLIDRAQKIVKHLTLFWEDSECDFMISQYDEFRNQFWDMIKS